MTSSDPLSERELRQLARHARRTWVYFIAFWAFAILAALAIELLDLSSGIVTSLLAALVVGVFVAAYLQFSEKCPRFHANLGWQVRLGIPDTCGRCGVVLNATRDPP